jgi:tetratricopeptide (TPR) repeat protein
VQEAQGQLETSQATLQMAIDLSPKSVRRQRRLGDLATRNEQHAAAERAYRRAIREGRGSCFAGAGEYLQLADLLAERHSSKGLAVLREGRMGLRAFPDEEIRVAVGQVFTYSRYKLPGDAARFLDQALEILNRCTPDLPAETLFELARACFLLGRIDKGLELIRRALRDSYDDARLAAMAQDLLNEFRIKEDCEAMIKDARAEVMRLNNMGVKLFEQEKGDEAARLLMAAADNLPRNRTINMNAVKILLNLMLRRGPNELYLASVAKYLDRLCKLGDKSEQFRQVQRAYRELIAV